MPVSTSSAKAEQADAVNVLMAVPEPYASFEPRVGGLPTVPRVGVRVTQEQAEQLQVLAKRCGLVLIQRKVG